MGFQLPSNQPCKGAERVYVQSRSWPADWIRNCPDCGPRLAAFNLSANSIVFPDNSAQDHGTPITINNLFPEEETMRRMTFVSAGLAVFAVLVFGQMTFAADMLSGTGS